MNRKAMLLTGLGIAGGLCLLYAVARRTVVRFDYKTLLHLTRLQPTFRKKVAALLAEAHKQGIDLRITSSERTCEEQNTLYNQGRSTPGQVVTNAPCGKSSHNYRLAVDVVEYKNGKPLWDNPRWEYIGKLGERIGLEWGGRWKSIVDKPHFQDLQGKSISERYNDYQLTGLLAFYEPDSTNS